MKYILSVSEYINYTKYILEVRFYLFCQMISFLLLLMSMMKSSKHDFLAAFKVSVCLHLGLALRPLPDPSTEY